MDVDVFALVALDTKEIGYLAASQVKQTMIFRSPLMEGKYHDEMLSERSSRIRGLRESGLTYQAIANEMGLDKAFVHRVCNFKSGIPRSSRYLRNFSFAAAAKRAGYVIAPNMGDVQETIPARADGTNQLLEAE